MDGSGAPETPMSSAESEPVAQVIVPADIDSDTAPNPEACARVHASATWRGETRAAAYHVLPPGGRGLTTFGPPRELSSLCNNHGNQCKFV